MMGKSSSGVMEVEKSSWVVEVDDEVHKLTEILEAEEKDWEKPCIYKLPPSVTELNKNNAYKPRVISFGPYHHDDPKLQRLEPHKHRALLRFLKSTGKSARHCVEMVRAVAEDLMDAYDSLDTKWRQDPEGFVKMMIRDGCFMLEVLLLESSLPSSSSATQPPAPPPPAKGDVSSYARNDPIFSEHGKLFVMPYIKRDMLMLENQLPMLILTRLLSIKRPQLVQVDDMVNRLIVGFCGPANDHHHHDGSQLGKRKHVLDVYRQALLSVEGDRDTRVVPTTSVGFCPKGKRRWPWSKDSNKLDHNILPSATELHETGISIQQSHSRGIITDIDFRCGVLYLPQIVVDDLTEFVFLNLIAFERFHVGLKNEVTSYVALMDDLIDNASDVKLLRSRNIEVVESAYGSDKAVAKLFNSLGKDISIDNNSSLMDVRRRAIRYSERPWNKWRGNLFQYYFTSPWSIISLVAASLLFGLTIIQTLFTIKQYYQPQSPPPLPSP
ncbi:OLC1v1033419C1 [Oldenlandia corymbosa var. corymbosa]|uniref:OLC1v1033419C1 n=1 Tax=Oldenlandia corymbosa var. corymbosa TaxID=529605 RepID=A0AAV1CPJ8_OLDCO|nr:OLC1v1033419C1 [Oldenlandia corymbosa var. corymbosa]